MKLTDICVNLSNSQFDADRTAILERAREHGVARQILVGTDLSSSRFCQQWATEHSDLFATAGIHPHDADHTSEDWIGEIATLASSPAVVAIGETGLDFNRNYSTRENQIACFSAQINLAARLDLPLFVHDRESEGMVLDMLKGAHGEIVIHCFTGTAAELRAYLDAGYYIGITGWICDTRRGENLRQMVSSIPLDRLLLETDAPFLRPHNLPSTWLQDFELSNRYKRRCEPAHLPYVLNVIREHRSESLAEIAEATHNNATRLFSLPS